MGCLLLYRVSYMMRPLTNFDFFKCLRSTTFLVKKVPCLDKRPFDIVMIHSFAKIDVRSSQMSFSRNPFLKVALEDLQMTSKGKIGS
jgi:hypothetical protein